MVAMHSWFCSAACTAVLLFACSAGINQVDFTAGVAQAGEQPVEGRIDAGHLMRHVERLASEELAGRGPGSFQADSTVAYVLRGFLSGGLDPGVGEASYLMSDPVFVNVHAQGTVGLRDQGRGYTFNRDWVAHGISGDGRDSSSVVFVGYGITAPEYGYDDYQYVHTKGKAVLALTGEPGDGLPDGPHLSTAGPPLHRDPFHKALHAQARGATSLMLVRGDPTGLDEDRIWRHPSWTGFGVAGIPVFVVTRAVAQNLLDTEGLDLGDLQFMIDKSLEPHSAELPGAWIECIVSMSRMQGRMVTVAGRRHGTGHGAVVVAAAYDGLGQGADSRNLALHPGAGDNASGVAVLLEIVRAMKDKPAGERSVYFVVYAGRHFSAAGLASFLTSAAVVPEGLEAVVDLGPLGSDGTLHIHGLPSAPWLAAVLEEVESSLTDPPRTIRHEVLPRVGSLKHLIDLGIPGILVTGSGDRRFGTPDDAPDTLNFDVMARAGEYVLALIEVLAADSVLK